MKQFVAVIAGACLIIGCGSTTSVFHKYRTVDALSDAPISVAMDAEQRAIVAVPAVADGSLRRVIVCAEPSPDATSELDSAVLATASLSEDQKASFAQLVFETVEEIGERNATIQLLRDGLYRQCEAYLNGIITADQYDKISNRYVDAMVTLLAIERLTASANTDATTTATAATTPQPVAAHVRLISSYFLNKENVDKCFAHMRAGEGLGESVGSEMQRRLEQMRAAEAAIGRHHAAVDGLRQGIEVLKSDVRAHVGTAEAWHEAIAEENKALAAERRRTSALETDILTFLEGAAVADDAALDEGVADRLERVASATADDLGDAEWLADAAAVVNAAARIVRGQQAVIAGVREKVAARTAQAPVLSSEEAEGLASESLKRMNESLEGVRGLLNEAQLETISAMDQGSTEALARLEELAGQLGTGLSFAEICKDMLTVSEAEER